MRSTSSKRDRKDATAEAATAPRQPEMKNPASSFPSLAGSSRVRRRVRAVTATAPDLPITVAFASDSAWCLPRTTSPAARSTLWPPGVPTSAGPMSACASLSCANSFHKACGGKVKSAYGFGANAACFRDSPITGAHLKPTEQAPWALILLPCPSEGVVTSVPRSGGS